MSTENFSELEPLNIKHMTFQEFQRINAQRSAEAFGHVPGSPEWPIQNWALAIAGEAGELCNLIKKALRGDFPVATIRSQILEELADVICYTDLAISHMGESTEQVVWDKFCKVSERVGWSEPGKQPE